MEALYELTHNYILSSAIVSWITAQTMKTILTLITTKKLQLERMFGAGGMPSAHSAFVCSMTLATARQEGFSSPMFAIAIILAAIVMYDAMGVRRAAGEQAKVINRIVFGIKNSDAAKNQTEEEGSQKSKVKHIVLDDMQFKKLKEYLGHTPLRCLRELF